MPLPGCVVALAALHGCCCLAAAAAPHPAYAVSPLTPAANMVLSLNNDAVCQLTRLCISVNPWERVCDIQCVMGMMLSKGSLSSAVQSCLLARRG